jgi:hypothetical protein
MTDILDTLQNGRLSIAEIKKLRAHIAELEAKGWNLCVSGDYKTFNEIVDGTRSAALEKKDD